MDLVGNGLYGLVEMMDEGVERVEVGLIEGFGDIMVVVFDVWFIFG